MILAGFKRIGLSVLISLFFAFPAMAAHPDTKSEIESLKRRIKALEQEQAQPEEPFALKALGKHLKFSGLLELEATYNKMEGGEESSDLVLATAQLSTEVNLNDHIGGHLILLWEEDETEPIDVDEAVIILSCPKTIFGQTPTFVGGKMYVPFGTFNSFMVTDPLTLDLGETNNTAALFALDGELWTLKGGVFNGDTDTEGDNDNIDSWVASLDVTPADWITFGASYLSDIAESDNGLVTDENLYRSSAPGAAAFVSVALGPFGFEGEYVTAVKRFDKEVVAVGEDLTGPRPRSWTLELAWTAMERFQLALRAEGADDFQDDLTRYGATASYGLFENTVLALEYLRGDAKGPDNDLTHTATAQLAFEF